MIRLLRHTVVVVVAAILYVNVIWFKMNYFREKYVNFSFAYLFFYVFLFVSLRSCFLVESGSVQLTVTLYLELNQKLNGVMTQSKYTTYPLYCVLFLYIWSIENRTQFLGNTVFVLQSIDCINNIKCYMATQRRTQGGALKACDPPKINWEGGGEGIRSPELNNLCICQKCYLDKTVRREKYRRTYLLI